MSELIPSYGADVQGEPVAQGLFRVGEQVRALVRDPGSCSTSAQTGAEVATGDLVGRAFHQGDPQARP